MPVPPDQPGGAAPEPRQEEWTKTRALDDDQAIARDRAQTSDPPAASSVKLPHRALEERTGARDQEPRYRTQEFLGLGATGEVYAVEDRNLRRVVAVKILGDASRDEDGIGHFINEARIVASLVHPNVLPIYDLDVTSDGRLYFTMPRISGRTLGALIEQSATGGRASPIATTAEVARVGVAVAQALAYAHHQGIVHQDVKPDNILIGEFGEVLLVDWGSAVRLQPGVKPALYGTPIYMSPEQARGESVDARSDLYSLGATLFHALLLRVPTWCENPEEFWRAKRDGDYQEPTSEERLRHGTVLLDIIAKCLASDPLLRYQNAEELLADLHAYQNGLAVTAHRETLGERLRRWCRHHGKAALIGSCLALLTAAVVVLCCGRQLEEMTHWGRPLIAADFSTPPGPEWKVGDGGFVVRNGWLESTGDAVNTLLLDRRLYGSIAVEYDGELLPGTRPCDISLGWCRDRSLASDGSKVTALQDAYRLQVGAYDNSGVMIDNQSGTLAFSPLQLQVGRVYHVRAEVEDDWLRLWVDGRLHCTWQDPFPFQGGYVFLYGHYPGKGFRNLRIYLRGVAQRIPATGVGDAFAAREQYPAAAEEYERVVASHPGTALGDEARYREGLCFWRLKRQDRAMAVWRPLRDGPLGDRVRLHDLDLAFARGDHAATCAGISRLWARADAKIRTGLALSWARYVNQLRSDHQLAALTPYLDLHDRLLRDEHEVDGADADALNATGRYQEVLDRYPDAPYSRAEALCGLGRYDEVIRDYPNYAWYVNLSCVLAGQFDRMDPSWEFLHPRALLLANRLQEAYAANSESFGAKSRALMAMGRLEQAMTENPQDGQLQTECQLLLGRTSGFDPRYAYLSDLVLGDAARALAECPPDSTERVQARWRLAVEAWIAGDRLALDRLSERDLHFDRDNEAVLGFYCWVLRPFLHALAGEAGAVARACSQVITVHPWVFEQRSRYDAQLLTGMIDDARFLAQPASLYAGARLLLLQAMRADLAGDGATASDRYRRWQATPAYARGEYPDPVLVRVVAWRLRSITSQSRPAAGHGTAP